MVLSEPDLFAREVSALVSSLPQIVFSPQVYPAYFPAAWPAPGLETEYDAGALPIPQSLGPLVCVTSPLRL